MFKRPARSASRQPSAVIRSGAVMRMVAWMKPMINTLFMVLSSFQSGSSAAKQRTDLVSQVPLAFFPFHGKHDEHDDQGLNDVYDDYGHIGHSLHLSRPASQNAEQDRGRDDPRRIVPGQ